MLALVEIVLGFCVFYTALCLLVRRPSSNMTRLLNLCGISPTEWDDPKYTSLSSSSDNSNSFAADDEKENSCLRRTFFPTAAEIVGNIDATQVPNCKHLTDSNDVIENDQFGIKSKHGRNESELQNEYDALVQLLPDAEPEDTYLTSAIDYKIVCIRCGGPTITYSVDLCQNTDSPPLSPDEDYCSKDNASVLNARETAGCYQEQKGQRVVLSEDKGLARGAITNQEASRNSTNSVLSYPVNAGDVQKSFEPILENMAEERSAVRRKNGVIERRQCVNCGDVNKRKNSDSVVTRQPVSVSYEQLPSASHDCSNVRKQKRQRNQRLRQNRALSHQKSASVSALPPPNASVNAAIGKDLRSCNKVTNANNPCHYNNNLQTALNNHRRSIELSNRSSVNFSDMSHVGNKKASFVNSVNGAPPIQMRNNAAEIRLKRNYLRSWSDSSNAQSSSNQQVLHRDLQTTNALKEKFQISSRRQQSLSSLNYAGQSANHSVYYPRQVPTNAPQYNKSLSCIIEPNSSSFSPSKKFEYLKLNRITEDNFDFWTRNGTYLSNLHLKEMKAGEVPCRVGSCIITEPLEEDYTPYLPSENFSRASNVKSAPGNMPQHSSKLASRRSYSAASLFKSPSKRFSRQHSESLSRLPPDIVQSTNANLNLEDPPKLQRHQSFRKVLRRASSVNKDLRRKIKSWSPFTTRTDLGGSSFYVNALNNDRDMMEETEDLANVDNSYGLSNLDLPNCRTRAVSLALLEKSINIKEFCPMQDSSKSPKRGPHFSGLDQKNSEKGVSQQVKSPEGWRRRSKSYRSVFERKQKSVSICGLPDYIRRKEERSQQS